MADSNFSAPLQSQYSMPVPPTLHYHGPEASARPQPGFSNYNSYAYESPSYPQYHSSPYGSQMSDSMSIPSQNAPFQYQQNRVPQYAHFQGQPISRPSPYYHAQPNVNMFQNGPNAPATSGPFQNTMLPGSPHPDFAGSSNGVDMLPMIEPLMPNGPQTFNMPPHGHMGSTHGYMPFQGRRPNYLQNQTMPMPTPPSIRFGGDVAQPTGQNRGAMMRGVNLGNSDQPRHPASPNRRPSYERQYPLSPTSQERRPPSFLGAHTRRSDRSISPRTSHRRSFDRYSTDLAPSSQSSEDNDADSRSRLLAHQRRLERRRNQARRDLGRAQVAADGNTPTQTQMQALRDKLRHFLPNELPEEASPMCDICQKDYSAKHVDPSEEEEVAIQLPCKHIFGEHCINTWFETCQKHKNKITCPMCRKLLVEPPARGPVIVPGPVAADHFMTFLSRMSDNRMGLSQVEASMLAQFARAGRDSSEGDLIQF